MVLVYRQNDRLWIKINVNVSSYFKVKIIWKGLFFTLKFTFDSSGNEIAIEI